MAGALGLLLLGGGAVGRSAFGAQAGALARDEVVLTSGIRIEGTVVSVAEEGVTSKTQGAEMTWPLGKVHSVTRGGKTETYNPRAKRTSHLKRDEAKPGGEPLGGASRSAPVQKPTTRPEPRFKRPKPEEALRFLKSLPRVWRNTRDFDPSAPSKKVLVQLWEDYTVQDLKTTRVMHPGGHIEDPKAPNRFSQRHLRLRPSDWKYFTALEQLEAFEATHDLEGITDECFFYLGQLSQSVTRLHIEMSEATGEGVRHLQNLKNLKSLSLNFSRTITDAALVHAAGIGSLEYIDVGACPGITGSGVAALSKLKNLRALKIGSCSLSDSSLRYFKALPVEELDMSNVEAGWIVRYRGGGRARFTVSFAGLRTLLASRDNLPNLKRLVLRKTKLSRQQKDLLAKLRPGLQVR